MDVYKQKWTTLEQEVFSLLCKRVGEKLSQREIAKILNVSPTAVSNVVKALKDLAIVEKTKTINFVSLNRDNSKMIDLKRIENLKSLYVTGLSDFLKFELTGSTIILFGSYSMGEDAHSSDIDFAVIGRKDKLLRLEKYEKLLNRPINVNFYPNWSSINRNLKNNILNGILLHGSVEL